MDAYRSVLINEIVFIVITTSVVLTCFILGFIFVPKFLNFCLTNQIKVGIRITIVLLAFVCIFSRIPRLSQLVLDLSQNSIEVYFGEVEMVSEKGNKYTEVYDLCDLENTYITSSVGKVDASIERCRARIVYAENSALLLEIDVYEILETRSPIIIL